MSRRNHMPSPFRKLTVVTSLAVLLAVSACQGEDITRTFGLTRDAPDEFQVTTRAPLSMPPDFTLRAPRPGAQRPQEESSRQSAEATLSPGAALDTGSAGVTPGQSALVAAAGPPVSNSIRNQVDSEVKLDGPSRTLTDRLMFWKAAPPPGTVVDPTREAQRLRQNAALGRNLEQGDTPIIQRKSAGGGLLDDIF